MGKAKDIDYKKVLKKKSLTSQELISLLDGRKKKLVDFLLIDIREPKEHQNLCIDGTDVLFPSSKMNLYPETIEELRHIDFVLYCSDGIRSKYLLGIFENMGYKQMTKLKGGILGFTGQTKHNSSPPNIF